MDVISYLDQKIESIRNTTHDSILELEKLKEIATKFQDINIINTKSSKIILCSKSVNNKVNNFNISKSCTCCEDAFLDLVSWIEVDGINIHSDPYYICIGRVLYNNIRIDHNWEDILKKYNLPKAAFDYTSKYIEEWIPANI